MSSHLRVTLVQTEIAWQDPATNRRNLAAHFRGLIGHTDLIVLPEMFSTGFSMEAEQLAEPMDGPTIGWMREEAAALGVALTGSLIVRDEDRCYNRLVWVRPDGSVAHYDKRHLFRMASEHRHYGAGAERLVVEHKGWRICPLVCYDLRFPVWSRNRGDYDLLLYVANWPAARRTHWQALLRARAIENLAPVVAVNRVGRDGNGVDYAGDSVALAATGETEFDAGDVTGAFRVTLDGDALVTWRERFPAHLDADRFEIRGASD